MSRRAAGQLLLRVAASGALLLVLLPASAAQAEESAGPPPELHCAHVVCGCGGETAVDRRVFFLTRGEGCFDVVCRCAAPDGAALGEAPPDEAALTPPETPTALTERRPPSGFGALLDRGNVGLWLEVGFPLFDLRFAYGVHQVFELGAGYRSYWGLSHTGYLSLRFRLYENATGDARLALGLLGGYAYVPDAEWATGTNSGFGELHLGFTVGRRGHALTADLGARLSWIKAHEECESDEWGYSYGCYSRLYDDDQGHLLVSPFVEIGYAGRIRRWVSFYISGGVEARIYVDRATGIGRFRTGFVFEW